MNNLKARPFKAGRRRMSKGKKLLIALSAVILVLTLATAGAYAAPEGGTLNNLVTTIFGENTETIDIIILLTVLTLAPSILVMLTGFTRIIIVLSFIRSAIGTQQTPPNPVLIGLALFLTYFVMSPVLTEIYETAYIPYTQEEITQEELIDTAMVPLREFMFRQTFNSDLKFFIELSETEAESLEELPNGTVISAFVTSEIKRAFQIGFFLFIPFIVIDMVVASTLMAMGMMMLPPAMISLPFKILLFVMIDGWQLIIGTLITGFG